MSNPPTIREFMAPIPATVEPDKSLDQAHNIMNNFDVRHLPVVNRAGHLVGILSSRDIALAESIGKKGKEHTVEEAMTAQPFTCGPDAHMHAVATEMADHKYGSAVVVDPDHPSRVVGLLTTIDLLRALALYTGHGSE